MTQQLRCAFQRVLADYGLGFIESVGLVYDPPSCSPQPDQAGGLTTTQPAASGCKDAPSPVSCVHWSPLWSGLPRAPLLWKYLRMYTAWTTYVIVCLLLVHLAAPRRMAGVVAVVPLYGILPLVGALSYRKVFLEARCLRRGQYRVNNNAKNNNNQPGDHSGPTAQPSGVPPTMTATANTWKADTASDPAARLCEGHTSTDQSSGVVLCTRCSRPWSLLLSLLTGCHAMLRGDLPPTPSWQWIRGDASLPCGTSPPFVASEQACPVAEPMAAGKQTTYQQLDKTLTLLVFSFFIVVVERTIPLFAIATGVGACLNALLYSLYVFDYRYVHEGATVAQEMTDFDSHTAYFLGFGTLCAFNQYCLARMAGSSLVAASLNFGLYGWHVAFSDHARRYPSRQPRDTWAIATGVHGDADDEKGHRERRAGMAWGSEWLPSAGVFGGWYRAIQCLTCYAGVLYRMALVFGLVTMVTAVI